MSLHAVSIAIDRVRATLRRRPSAGGGADAPAVAHWQGGTRVATRHPNGAEVVTDMSPELGGSGEHPSPGWLSRAALASCATTSIVFTAAAEGVALQTLEVRVDTWSDACGLFGLPAADGTPADPAPRDHVMAVRIAAPGTDAAALQALVARALACSPVPAALGRALPLAVRVEVG